MATLLSVIEALPEPDEKTWQWSDRSSHTNCLAALLNKALPDEREAIYSDLGDLIDQSGTTSIRYETDGMTEIRRLLNNDDVADIKVDHFKDCLVLLEKHGFKLMLSVDEQGTLAGVRPS